MENKPNSYFFLVLWKELFPAFMGMCCFSLHTGPQHCASRMITIYFFPHTAEPGVTPSDPIEIDFVVELLASAN